MSKQQIIDRILADANAEAEAIVALANEKALKMLAAADAYAAKEREDVSRECEDYAKDVSEKTAAAARLECAKIALAEKRKVLDYAYEVALAKLKEYSLQDPLTFYAKLLETYADRGDVVYFPEGFSLADEVAALPVFSAKELKLATDRAKIDGGVLLVGEKADKDVSLEALIRRDKDVHLSEVATEIFK